ncbi:tetratricopeptide repeat protein [candidate division KSB1 bacterium]|nr:tetratricopeptide repeat protein [candidate division KSB1 bacterium]
MKTIHPVSCLIIFVVTISTGTAFAQQSPEYLLQAGLYAEEVKGDLNEALRCYQKIVQDFPDNRRVAAKAQLQIGICYEKLGQQNAIAAYQKVLENYPDQREIVALARERLAQAKIRDQKSKIHPLTKYYFERFGIDVTTSTSYDGKYLAYTDWTTGSLMIKELRNSQNVIRNPKSTIKDPLSKVRIVEADPSRSPEYAYYPAWSRDGKYIAYSWYRGPNFIELRVVSVADGKSQVIYSDPKFIINPDDWSPDGKTIVCETLNFERETFKRLALIRVDKKELQDILLLNDNTRRLQFSPEGKYIVYNLERHQRIFMLALEDLQQADVPANLPSLAGYDGPIWSPDGKLILCRNLGSYDLWAIPMQNGKPAGKPYLVQTDLSKALLSLKSVAPPLTQMNQSMNENAIFRKAINAARSFVEEFTSPILDPAWSVFEWKGPNIYDYTTFGRYSLTDRPGHLRYYLNPIMKPGYLCDYLPEFTGHYWWYPSLEISRPLSGDHWVLEARVTYSMIDGANGRDFDLIVYFDPERDRQTALVVERRKGMYKEHDLYASLNDRGLNVAKSENCHSSNDALGVTQFTYIYRITRADTLVQVELSDDDGANFRQVLSASLRPDLRSQPQLLALTGQSWFVPAGSYADWDYIRFRNVDFGLRKNGK